MKKIVVATALLMSLQSAYALTPLTFEEHSKDFPVFKDSHQLQTPFGTGTPSASYPTLADIDNDDDLDLFIGTGEGTIVFYENIGTKERPDFIMKNEKFLGIDKNEYILLPTFGDTDKDGDLDLYFGDYSKTLTFYKNKGNAEKENLVTATGSEASVDVKNMAAPALVDIDNDTDSDLFVGNFEGSIHYYENVSTSSTPLFILTDATYLNIDEEEMSVPTFADIDNDGDFDLFISNAEGIIKKYLNEGTNQKAKFTLVETAFITEETGYTYPTFGDLDNDNDLDLLVGNNHGRTKFFKNTGTETSPKFEKITDEYFFIDLGKNAHISFADLDNDNDADMYSVSRENYLMAYENTGNDKSPKYTYKDLSNLVTLEPYTYDFTFADLDNDRDLDLITSEYNYDTEDQEGKLTYYKNIGTVNTPKFELNNTAFKSMNVNEAVSPEFFDYDNDGDLDLFLGTPEGKIMYYMNKGTTTDAAFELVSETFEEIDVLGFAVPRFTDIDLDLDYDLIVGNEFGRIFYFENVKGNITKNFLNRGELTPDIGDYSSVAVYDMNHDKKPDIFATSESGSVHYFAQNSTNIYPPEDVSGVKLTMDKNRILTLSWKASIDSEGDLKNYKFYQEKNDDGFKGGSEVHKDLRQMTIVDLAEGSKYRFRISAVDQSNLESEGVYVYAERTGDDLNVTYKYPFKEVTAEPTEAPEEFCSGFVDVRKELVTQDLCDAIKFVKDEKIFSGNDDGTLAIDRPINRAEVTKVLLEAFDYIVETDVKDSPFTDVIKTEWYAKYVVTAKKQNIIQGYPDLTFQPQRTTNKVELLKLILEMAHTDFSKVDIGTSLASDVTSNVENEWFIKYINYAIEKNLITLQDGLLFPDKPMTRGDVIMILYQMKLKNLGGL